MGGGACFLSLCVELLESFHLRRLWFGDAHQRVDGTVLLSSVCGRKGIGVFGGTFETTTDRLALVYKFGRTNGNSLGQHLILEERTPRTKEEVTVSFVALSLGAVQITWVYFF